MGTEHFKAILLNGTPESTGEFNWYLTEGWGVVDRFETPTWIVVMVSKVE